MSLEANSVHVSPRYGLLNSAYFKDFHLHIFSIKLISPVIAVYKQTVFLISLNCPRIPYKNFDGYLWKKIEKDIHESRLLCCNLNIVRPII